MHRLLFVDDEPTLLRGIDRLLGADYDLDTALSGEKALEQIASNGPYSAIFTDMRMPQMDGLQFLERAHQATPDSTCVMLTGNNDQETAMRAVNEGHVFRFLNKPCDGGSLKQAIDDALRQHELVRGEKELLQGTFLGVIKAFSEVVEVSQPHLVGQSRSLEEKVEILREALSISERWEYRLAARLSLLGIALLPSEDRLGFEQMTHSSEQVSNAIVTGAAITQRLLTGIPRLGLVAAICGYSEEVTGKVCSLKPASQGAVTQVGATLLRIATHWNFLGRQGVEATKVCQELRTILPEIHAELLDAVRDTTPEEASPESVELPINELREGMVLAADLCDPAGATLVRRGVRLTSTMVAKLRETGGFGTVQITSATAAPLSPHAI